MRAATSADTPATRGATRLGFWVAGFGVACWAPLVPYARQRLQADDATLGLLLLCLGIGSVVAMLRTGPLCARHGCRPVIVASGAGLTLLLPLLSVVSMPWQLALALLLFGASLGTLDVAINVHAVEVERDAGRPLMSNFHALFSVGGFSGSALMTFLLSLSLAPLTAALLCSALMAVALLVARPRLLAAAAGEEQDAFALPRGRVRLLALLACVMFLVEGALLDWGALLLVDSRLAEAARAGAGYAVFSVAMMVGRFGGDAFVARFGDRLAMAGGGLLAIAGFVLLLASARLEPALAGFALIGLGASNVVPVLFRQAGRQQDMSAAMAVSAMSIAGYGGFLLGPAAIGFVSQRAGLPAAFWGLAALMLLVPLCARRVAVA